MAARLESGSAVGVEYDSADESAATPAHIFKGREISGLHPAGALLRTIGREGEVVGLLTIAQKLSRNLGARS